jgi:D-aminopeptidase
VIATDAPLLPHELKRLARRATHGIARVGAISEDSSGDLFLAFSTASLRATGEVSSESSNELFGGVVQATEEAVINALVAAETMRGRTTCEAIDVPRLQDYLRQHGRLGHGIRSSVPSEMRSR